MQLVDQSLPLDGDSMREKLNGLRYGIEFAESKEHDGTIPRWMSCTIYRTDRVKTITVKEYLVELQTEHPCWQVMPRRMLRHHAMQQCARLAFGITVTECKSPAVVAAKPNQSTQSLTPSSKEKSAVSHRAMLKTYLLHEGQPKFSRTRIRKNNFPSE